MSLPMEVAEESGASKRVPARDTPPLFTYAFYGASPGGTEFFYVAVAAKIYLFAAAEALRAAFFPLFLASEEDMASGRRFIAAVTRRRRRYMQLPLFDMFAADYRERLENWVVATGNTPSNQS